MLLSSGSWKDLRTTLGVRLVNNSDKYLSQYILDEISTFKRLKLYMLRRRLCFNSTFVMSVRQIAYRELDTLSVAES